MHQTLLTVHPVNQEHLAEVMQDMEQMCAPTIMVVDCGDHYMALEGVHRLRAACLLGLAPALKVLDEDDVLTSDDLPQWDDLVPGETYTAGEIAEMAHDSGNGCYRLQDDGTLELVF